MKKSGANKLRYDILVLKVDLPLIDSSIRNQIGSAIHKKLTTFPEIYGEPLRGELSGYWKLRVGDWRVVYSIKNGEVFIFGIRNRNNIYKVMKKRLKNK